MKFKQFLIESDRDVIKDAINVRNPESGVEYIKDIVVNNLNLLKYAISIQKRKVLDDIDNDIENSILEDLSKKLRLWKDIFKTRWPDEESDNLSPNKPKPNQPPVDANSKVPLDVFNKMQGNEEDPETKK